MPPEKLTAEELEKILTESPPSDEFEIAPDSLLLGSLASVDRKLLANLATEEHHARGEILCREGENGDLETG